jgi:hypothetical protein
MSNPAETYENYMVPTLFAPWASRLVQAANPRPGERILDVACEGKASLDEDTADFAAAATPVPASGLRAGRVERAKAGSWHQRRCGQRRHRGET